MGFQGISKEEFEGDFEGHFRRSSRGSLRGTWRGNGGRLGGRLGRGLVVKLMSVQVQVWPDSIYSSNLFL